MKKNQIDFITLGCSKNLVDSEVLMKQFEANGYKCTHDSKRPQGEIAVINTCGFIGDAKEESINTILEFADAKEKGRLKKLFVMGCLSQRYRSELKRKYRRLTNITASLIISNFWLIWEKLKYLHVKALGY